MFYSVAKVHAPNKSTGSSWEVVADFESQGIIRELPCPPPEGSFFMWDYDHGGRVIGVVQHHVDKERINLEIYVEEVTSQGDYAARLLRQVP